MFVFLFYVGCIFSLYTEDVIAYQSVFQECGVVSGLEFNTAVCHFRLCHFGSSYYEDYILI